MKYVIDLKELGKEKTQTGDTIAEYVVNVSAKDTNKLYAETKAQVSVDWKGRVYVSTDKIKWGNNISDSQKEEIKNEIEFFLTRYVKGEKNENN